jgi:hypothetical protein
MFPDKIAEAQDALILNLHLNPADQEGMKRRSMKKGK